MQAAELAFDIWSSMMNKMIVANLVHRPIRSLISIVAIALEVTLILLIVGSVLWHRERLEAEPDCGHWRGCDCAAAGIVFPGRVSAARPCR